MKEHLILCENHFIELLVNPVNFASINENIWISFTLESFFSFFINFIFFIRKINVNYKNSEKEKY